LLDGQTFEWEFFHVREHGARMLGAASSFKLLTLQDFPRF